MLFWNADAQNDPTFSTLSPLAGTSVFAVQDNKVSHDFFTLTNAFDTLTIFNKSFN